ncbi:hypothetical protein K443DRAFT_125779 [Laccaria amethystina LaAM-08-1]|uniref:Uncharacterized protein n=1 Tax=Laccaria amethystina LaAM-08-1 TaxID=1095629 RepID=A0A0C9X996_9AGAR|nr:hypothetical protein K443DRAFT_125779 [Laccaria amethystina LaAM-08-1]
MVSTHSHYSFSPSSSSQITNGPIQPGQSNITTDHEAAALSLRAACLAGCGATLRGTPASSEICFLPDQWTPTAALIAKAPKRDASPEPPVESYAVDIRRYSTLPPSKIQKRLKASGVECVYLTRSGTPRFVAYFRYSEISDRQSATTDALNVWVGYSAVKVHKLLKLEEVPPATKGMLPL